MRNHRRQAFTLVETLTVIAILAILAGIIFAMTAPSREKAKQTVCAAQLRQMHAAVMMYSSDVGAGEEIPGLGEMSCVAHYGFTALNPYLKSEEIRTCPDFPADLKGIFWSTYTWRPVVSEPGQSPGEQEMIRKQREEIARVGSAFAMWTCGTHDEVYYRPSEPDVNPLLAEPYMLEVSVAGSLFSGRRTYPRSNLIDAARSLRKG